ncbi:MAG: hypothetical protein PWQ70_2206 [Clostridiales bacterium]|nr:hypothetical protein [Clostridiales bacterium]
MPINLETQVSASVILDKEIYKKIKELAKKNKRSASAQMAYMLEEQLKNLKSDK